METEPSRVRCALIGALHGAGAYLGCALVLCALATGLTAGAKELSPPVASGLIVLAAFLHFGLFPLPIAAGIGALAASLGQPKGPARRVWLTVLPLTFVLPLAFLAIAAMRPA